MHLKVPTRELHDSIVRKCKEGRKTVSSHAAVVVVVVVALLVLFLVVVVVVVVVMEVSPDDIDVLLLSWRRSVAFC